MNNDEYLKYIKFEKVKREMIDFIEIHLAEHCNLNCASCDHFSPIAEKEFYDLDKYIKDIKRLSFVTDGKINRILLLGGEPLLNKDIVSYIDITRECFSNSEIVIVTNGLLLPKMDDSFFECLNRNDVGLEITKYPMEKVYDKIESILINNKVKYKYFNSTSSKKTRHKLPLDLDGKQDMNNSYNKCYMGGRCVQFKAGKIYTCSTVAYINHFEKKFNVNLERTVNDYIDVYSCNDIKEIIDYLNKPIDFCRFCDVDNRKYKLDWGVSKGDIDEWV